jgi:hypothetical protein
MWHSEYGFWYEVLGCVNGTVARGDCSCPVDVASQSQSAQMSRLFGDRADVVL